MSEDGRMKVKGRMRTKKFSVAMGMKERRLSLIYLKSEKDQNNNESDSGPSSENEDGKGKPPAKAKSVDMILDKRTGKLVKNYDYTLFNPYTNQQAQSDKERPVTSNTNKTPFDKTDVKVLVELKKVIKNKAMDKYADYDQRQFKLATPSNSVESFKNVIITKHFPKKDVELHRIESHMDESIVSIVNAEYNKLRQDKAKTAKPGSAPKVLPKVKVTNLVAIRDYRSWEPLEVQVNYETEQAQLTEYEFSTSACSDSNSVEKDLKNRADEELRRLEMENHELEQRLLSTDADVIQARRLEAEKERWPRYVRVENWKNVVTSGNVPSWLDEPVDKGVYKLVDTGDENTPVPYSKEWEDQVLATRPVAVSGRDLRHKYEREQTQEAWNNFDDILDRFRAACERGECEMTMKGLEGFIAIGGITPTERDRMEFEKRLEIIKAEEAAKENQTIEPRPMSSKQQKRLKNKNRRDGKNKIPTRLMANPPNKGSGQMQKSQSKSTHKKQPSASVFKRLSKPDLTHTAIPRPVKPTAPVRQVPAKPKETTAVTRRMEYWQKLQVQQKFYKEKMKKLEKKTPDKAANDKKEIGPLGENPESVEGSKVDLRTKEWIDSLMKPKPEEIEIAGKKKTGRKSAQSVAEVDSEVISEIFKADTSMDTDSSIKMSLSDHMTSDLTSIQTGHLSTSMSISDGRFLSDMESPPPTKTPAKTSKNQFGKTKQPHPLRVAKKNSKQALGKSKAEVTTKPGNTHKRISKSGSKIKTKPEKLDLRVLANSDTVLQLFEKIPAVYEQPPVQEVPSSPIPTSIPSATEDSDDNSYHNPIYEFVYDEGKAVKQISTISSRHLIGSMASGLMKPKKSSDKVKPKGKLSKEKNGSRKGSVAGMSGRGKSQIVHTVVSSEVECHLVEKPSSKTQSTAKRLGLGLGPRPKPSPSGIIHTVKTELPVPDKRVPSPSPRTLLHITSSKDGESAKFETSPWIPLKASKSKPVWNLSHPKDSNIYAVDEFKAPSPKKSSTLLPSLSQKNTIKTRHSSEMPGCPPPRLDEFVVSSGVRQVPKGRVSRKPSQCIIPQPSKPDVKETLKPTASRQSAARSGSNLKMNTATPTKPPSRLPTATKKPRPVTPRPVVPVPQTGRSSSKSTTESRKGMPMIKLPPHTIVTQPTRGMGPTPLYYGYKPRKKIEHMERGPTPVFSNEYSRQHWLRTVYLSNYDPNNNPEFPDPTEYPPRFSPKKIGRHTTPEKFESIKEEDL